MTLRVICVGAGIASLSAAVALRKHASIILLEAANNIEDANVRAAGIALFSCGVHVLKETLGIDPVEDVHGVKVNSILLMKWNDGLVEREIAPPGKKWYTAHRGSLLDALREKAISEKGEGVPAMLMYGKTVTDVDVESGRVRTEDGSTYEADLIIGGDGVRSVTRKSITQTTVQPSGLSVYRWTMPPTSWDYLPDQDKAILNPIVGPEARHICVMDSPDKRLVMYRCHESGLLNGLLILPDFNLPHTSEDWSSSGSIDHLQSMVKDLNEPMRSLVSCVSSCGLWQLRKQAPLRSWNRGKAIILGDAAHPMLPFQAMAGSLAMEDAETLQYCLNGIGWNPERVPEALSRVFCTRFLRCSLIQHFSNTSSFGNEFMERAEKWSLERAMSGENMVPVTNAVDDVVQRDIATKVRETAAAVDVRTASAWVTDYKLVDFLRNGREYILEKAYV